MAKPTPWETPGADITQTKSDAWVAERFLASVGELLSETPAADRLAALDGIAGTVYRLVESGDLDETQARRDLIRNAESAGLAKGDYLRVLDDVKTAVQGKPPPKPKPKAKAKRQKKVPKYSPGIATPMTGAEFMGADFPPFEWVVQDMLPMGAYCLFWGAAKSGKSIMMLDLVIALDTGRTGPPWGVGFLGREVKRSKVLLISLEDGHRRVQERAKKAKWTPSKDFGFMTEIPPLNKVRGNDKSVTGSGMRSLEAYAQDYDVIIIDTMIRAVDRASNESNNMQMGAVGNDLADIAHKNNVLIMVVDHTGKGEGYGPRGASAKMGAYDIGLSLARKKGEREAVLSLECRDYEEFDMTVRMIGDAAGWEYLGTGAVIHGIRDNNATIKAMKNHPDHLDGLTQKQIAEWRKVSQPAVSKALARLDKLGGVYSEDVKGSNEKLWFIT